VGLDVTCSGAQIIGGIIQDTRMLLDTNLIVKKDQKVDSKRSICTEILNALMPEVKDYLKNLNIYGVEGAVLSVMNQDFVKGCLIFGRKLFSGSLKNIINLAF